MCFVTKTLGFMHVNLFYSSLHGVFHILWHIIKVSLNCKGCLAVKAQNKNSLRTMSCSVRSFEVLIQMADGEDQE